MWNIRKLVSKGDYLYAVVPEHPNKTKNNYVLFHRIVVENNIGRMLTKDEIVHHKDENKKNNDISNLEILNSSKHASLHGLQQGRMVCDLKCPNCKNEFTRNKNKTHLTRKEYKFTCCSPSCRGSFSRKIQLNRIKENELIQCISENIIKEYRVFTEI